MSTGFAFPSPTVTFLYAYPLPLPLPTFRYLCQAWWTCFSSPGRPYTWRNRSDCVLATEEPLSVLAPTVRRRLDIDVKPEPGWQGVVPDWRGIPCRIGRAELWLPVQGNLPPRPLSLLVLLPKREPAEGLPYVYLGMQFFVEYRVVISLDCSQRHGSLRIP